MPPSTVWYLVAMAITLVVAAVLSSRLGVRVVTAADDVVLRAVARVRAAALTDVFRWVDDVGTSSWTVRAVAWATIVVLVVFRRLRYLAVYLGALLVGSFGALVTVPAVGRMRPESVSRLVAWDGYSFPSRPVAVAGLVLAGLVYAVVPSARWRTRAKFAAALVLGTFALARVYLGVDHPTDVLAGLVIGWAFPVVAFRAFAPEESFPVTYRRGQRAHLEISPARRDAVVQALEHQLGLTVVGIEPCGGGGSAGSTPLRLTVHDASKGTREVFAKLYAVNHVRSDRWYKFVRTILYGRLEDEKPFSTVRRLAEYEDHMLRLFRDVGVRSPAPIGLAEITPEREYVIVMELFEDAAELGTSPIEVPVIDSALAIVRRLWDAGLAHRDIKPSNVLTRDDEALLIDVAFAAVRPTPWRQAVDLANMMLTLALTSTSELVYERALLQFEPDDIAEAFAATRGVTVPTQLRARLRADGRALAKSFAQMAPSRGPIRIQVWTLRRVGVTAAVVVGVAVAIGLGIAYVNVADLL